MRKSAPVILLFVVLISFHEGSPVDPVARAESEEVQPEPTILDQGDLVLGETQERTLAPGTVHAWQVTVEAGQFVELEVEPETFDASLRLEDPNGQPPTELDLGPTGYEEKASWITDAAGTWTLQVMLSKGTQAGTYTVHWTTARSATESDAGVVEAQRVFHRARSFHLAGNYDDAEPLYRQALTLRESSLGPDHPDVATSLNSLANLYQIQGRYAEAEPLYQRSLSIREKSLGPDHPRVADSLNSLAILYREQARYAEAEPLYERSLSIYEKALGPDHPDVAQSLKNLAIVYVSQVCPVRSKWTDKG